MIAPTARLLATTPPSPAEPRATQPANDSFKEQLFENFSSSISRPTALPDRPSTERSTAQEPRNAPADRPERASRESQPTNENDGSRTSQTDQSANTSTEPVQHTDDAATDESPSNADETEAVASSAEGADQNTESANDTDAVAIAPHVIDESKAGTKASDAQAAATGHKPRVQGGNANPAPSSAAPSTGAVSSTIDPALNAVNQNGDGASGDNTGEGEPKPQNAGPDKTTATGSRATQANAPAAFTSAISNVASDSGVTQPNAPQTNAASPQAAGNANPADGPDALNEARLARGLKSALNQQGGNVTLRLTPPEMGTVRIQMQLQGTQVTAQFHAETDAARSLLQQQLGQLRSALEGQGLSVERIGVQSMSGSSASSFNGSSTQQQGQNFSQDQNANPDGRSRGFFQQSRDSNDPSSHRDQQPSDEFADLVADLN